MADALAKYTEAERRLAVLDRERGELDAKVQQSKREFAAAVTEMDDQRAEKAQKQWVSAEKRLTDLDAARAVHVDAVAHWSREVSRAQRLQAHETQRVVGEDAEKLGDVIMATADQLMEKFKELEALHTVASTARDVERDADRALNEQTPVLPGVKYRSGLGVVWDALDQLRLALRERARHRAVSISGTVGSPAENAVVSGA